MLLPGVGYLSGIYKFHSDVGCLYPLFHIRISTWWPFIPQWLFLIEDSDNNIDVPQLCLNNQIFFSFIFIKWLHKKLLFKSIRWEGHNITFLNIRSELNLDSPIFRTVNIFSSESLHKAKLKHQVPTPLNCNILKHPYQT